MNKTEFTLFLIIIKKCLKMTTPKKSDIIKFMKDNHEVERKESYENKSN